MGRIKKKKCLEKVRQVCLADKAMDHFRLLNVLPFPVLLPPLVSHNSLGSHQEYLKNPL